MIHRSRLRDMDARTALQAAAEARRTADREEADLLALAVHLVDLHPIDIDDERPVASWAVPQFAVPNDGDDQPPPPPLLAGEGTPYVAELAVAELGAVLDISYQSALSFVSDSLELCYRLPRLWALVMAGTLKAWQARQVATLTTGLSREAVDFTDRHVATVARFGRVPSMGALKALVHEALCQHDPDAAAGVEQAALDRRGVWFDHRESVATTTVHAILDTADALDLDQTVADLSAALGRLGDRSPTDVRRARALGTLADPQRSLTLLTGGAENGDTQTGARGEVVSRRKATLYVHVNAADLADGAGAGRVERLGAATLTLLRDWLDRHPQLSVRPVLDMARRDGTETHDPPSWMRELVMLRDVGCVFPGCGVDARSCDLDHVEPFHATSEPEPASYSVSEPQTRPDNLACLCRRHHRLKTHAAWTYRRERAPDGSTRYVWTSPTRRRYVVTRSPAAGALSA